ncbi:MAG TPA: hypothetical protein VN701_00455, partial [Candidatus Paceibacterota bacterium]|nr:hypothetical protein [Candidatus Paceibacterota bacterium]
MQEQNNGREQNFLAWMAEELGVVMQPFKPVAWYDKNFDWFICMAEDVSYTSFTTSSPSMELFKDHQTEKIVGFKVLGFSHLPHEVRNSFMGLAPDADDVGNIEALWSINAREMAESMSKEEEAFFQELEARGGLDADEKALFKDFIEHC